MNTMSMQSDPFVVLGVPSDSSEVEVRARYLQLVKQFPPDREPDRFREIQAAFQAAKDPMVLARKLTSPIDDEARDWTNVLEAHKLRPPALSPDFILSLGNRPDKSDSSDAKTSAAPDDVAPDDPNAKQHFIEQAHD